MTFPTLLLCWIAASLPGQVLLPDGAPAVAAQVRLMDSTGLIHAPVITDAEGRFIVQLEGTAPWRVVAEYGSFTPAAAQVADPPPQEVVLTLGPAAFSALTEVLAPAPPRPRHRVKPSSLMASGEVLDGLESTAAAARIGAGGAGDTASVRGLARRRVATHLDGARLPGFRRVGTSLEAIDPFLLEEVAVEPGGRSAVAGTDAIGGVVEVRTLGPKQVRQVRLQGVSASREWAAMASQPLLGDGPTDLVLAASVRRARDVHTPLGVQRPSGYERGNLLLTGGGDTAHGTWAGRLLLAALDDVGRPRWQREDRPTAVPASFLGRLGGTWWGEAPAWLPADNLEATLTIGRRREATLRSRNGIETQRSDAAAWDFDSRLVAHGQHRGHRLAAAVTLSGVLEQEARVVAEGVEAHPLRGGWLADLGVVVSDRFSPRKGWELELGLRGDMISDRARTGTGTATSSFSAITGQAQVNRRLGNWTLWAATARAFRAPTLDERYYTGPTGRGTVSGSPELEPETGLTAEAGASLRHAGWQASVSAFRTRLNRPIERTEVAEDQFVYRNLDGAHLLGIEASIATSDGRPFLARLVAAWVRGNSSGGTALNDVPTGRLTATGEYSGERWRAGGRLLAAAAKGRPGPAEVKRPAWARLDLWAGGRLAAGFELRAELRNALDARIWPSADRLAIPAAGRSLSLTLTWSEPQ